jgi:phosphate starvation-inducible PhoH-like protein
MSRAGRARSNKVIRESNKRGRVNSEIPKNLLEVSTLKRSKPLLPLNQKQEDYIYLLKSKTIIFATGSAGSGKSYVAGAYASKLLEDKDIDTIVLTRALVEAGEKLGALPGEVKDKYAPYIEPYRDIFEDRLGKGFTKYLIDSEKIIGRPLAYMRSKTFHKSVVILSEAQNTTPDQMFLLLTRLGEGSILIIEGDIKQKDIRGVSGLEDALQVIGHLDSVGSVYFDTDDCVRSDIVKEILKAYEGED